MPQNGTTNQQINIQTTGAGPGFPAISGIVGQAGYPSAGPIKGAVIPYWSYGTGAPTFIAPYGSLYTDTAAGVGASRFYMFVPQSNSPGKWQVIA